MSNFPGQLIEYPRISIDRFDNENLSSAVYFLSHCHQDHMVGLESDGFFNHIRSRGLKLYCHQITAKLLLCEERYQWLQPHLISLATNDPRVIEVPLLEGQNRTLTICVTLLSAHHCVGSVMFLFEGPNGTVLYTGDFRLTLTELSNMQHLKAGHLVKCIDSLYIDSTFCSGASVAFPSRHESYEVILTETRKWLAKSPKHKVLLYTASKYAHEYLFVQLYSALGEKIHVQGWKVKGYESIASLSRCITKIPSESRIHACSFWDNDSELDGLEMLNRPVAYSKRRCMQDVQFCPAMDRHSPLVLTIKPSTMYFHQNVALDDTVKWQSPNYLRVCYSIHGSMSEICDMIAYLRPKRVQPNVIPVGSSHCAVTNLLSDLIQPRTISPVPHRMKSDDSTNVIVQEDMPIVLIPRTRSQRQSELFEFVVDESTVSESSSTVIVQTVPKRRISIIELD